MSSKTNLLKVALIGNPNSGKSSLFNVLTGMRQTVSNFPGVTVDKKIGSAILNNGNQVSVIDFPGLYSLHANSSDEKVVVNVISNPQDENYPDLAIYIADATHLERHLLLATQIVDLQIPMIFAVNMTDIIAERGQTIDVHVLEKYLGVPVVPISSREEQNIDQLKSHVQEFIENGPQNFINQEPKYKIPKSLNAFLGEVSELTKDSNAYRNKIYGHHHDWLHHLSQEKEQGIEWAVARNGFDNIRQQIDETMSRYGSFSEVARNTISAGKFAPQSRTDKIDSIITHRFFGPLIFFFLMFLMFQAIYAWSSAPMDWIEGFFGAAQSWVKDTMPSAWYTDLLADGVIAGLGGVVIFVPQIAILFLLISILEESGYMSRAVFMFDGIMQKFGLNGRSIVSLVSSGACAIPAIMATRTISSWKERLNTILVSPIISCSARIPVYAILIGFVVPEQTVWGIFNAQGLAFMGLYLLGIIGALAAALVFNTLLKSDDENSYLMIELPQYKPPIWKNAFLNVKEKVTTFIWEAGKVIFFISIILWFLASYGPSRAMQLADEEANSYIIQNNLDDQAAEDYIAGKKIEASYAGHLGKFIEPAIKPLGFDWKIGIALLTSFAAREVFVGTMATIYSVGSSDDESTIRDKMQAEIRPDTGGKMYSPATALSLLIFYVFAMQCMSTLAVVKRETKSWKWPIIQFLYMSVLAYVGSFIAYQLLS